MSKLKWLLVFAAGYVAGSAAGRQRYEQIRSGAQRIASNPRVQAGVKSAQETVAEKAPVVATAIKDKTTQAAGAVADKVRSDDPGVTGDTDGTDATGSAVRAPHPEPADGGPAIS